MLAPAWTLDHTLKRKVSGGVVAAQKWVNRALTCDDACQRFSSVITVSRNRRAKTGPRTLPVLAVTPPAAAAISPADDDLLILGVTLVPTSQCPNTRTRSSASAATESETTSGTLGGHSTG